MSTQQKKKMEGNSYLPYEPSDIRTLMYEPWEVSDQPYRLHAAYALSCLCDAIAPVVDEDEPQEDDPRNCIWGMSVPKNIIDRLALDIQEDFNDAARNYKRIKVWNHYYAIRKVNAFDTKRLHLIFRFPLNNGEYTITREGIMNLVSPTPEALKPYEVSRNEAKANRTFGRQVIMLAEDDKKKGWDKLTDMEIIVYLWALFYNKYQNYNFLQFKQEYKDYLYVTDKDIKSCYNKKSAFSDRPEGMFPFSATKVQEWNELHNQKSYAANIAAEDAENYWYDVALNKSFKPIDFK